MAKYDRERFEEAAKAYFKEHGLDPTPADAEAQAAVTKARAGKLAIKLGEKHEAHAGLVAVSTLRESIARRFIRLSVFPLAPVPKKTSEKPKAAPATKAAGSPKTKGGTSAKTPRTEAPAPTPEAPAQETPAAAAS